MSAPSSRSIRGPSLHRLGRRRRRQRQQLAAAGSPPRSPSARHWRRRPARRPGRGAAATELDVARSRHRERRAFDQIDAAQHPHPPARPRRAAPAAPLLSVLDRGPRDAGRQFGDDIELGDRGANQLAGDR